MKASLIKKLDRRLVKIAKTVKIISHISWDQHHCDRFLKAYRKGNATLPKIPKRDVDLSKKKEALKKIMERCDMKHPLGEFLHATAHNYLRAAELLECSGTAKFTALSKELFGSPRDSINGSELSTFEAAEHFLSATKDFSDMSAVPDQDCCLLPEFVADHLEKQANKLFKNDPIKVIVDPKLMSRAAAGAKVIRIRDATCFSEGEVAQLLEHEAFVHSLTGINGRNQPLLTSMSLNPPRVTATQEGLAVFAELITNAMNLNRLQRISLRVKAIQLGLEGANFIEIFEFFLATGMSEFEAFHSSARIFRGGNVKGKYVFTKDTTYLRGFVEVHSFLLGSMQTRNFMYPHYLCAGKLATDDIEVLEPFFENGMISRPQYEPRWITDRSSLLAFLLYATFVSELRVQQPKLTRKKHAPLL